MAAKALTVEEKITSCILKIVADYGFFATLLLTLNRQEMSENAPIKTMSTDGEHLFYYPSYVHRLDMGELSFVMIHETMHCALGHMWRREGRMFELFNCACDFAVNALIKKLVDILYEKNKSMLDESMIHKITMPKDVLYDKQFEDMSAEEIYDVLKKEATIQYSDGNSQNQQDNANGSSQSQSKQNGQGKGNGRSGSTKSNQSSGSDGGGSNSSDEQDEQENNQSDNSEDNGQNQTSGSSNDSSDNDQNQNQQNQNQSGGVGTPPQKQKSLKGATLKIHGHTFKIPDNHQCWDNADKMDPSKKMQKASEWAGKLINANEQLKNQGLSPAGLLRELDKLTKPKKDWRTLLREFIEMDVFDYSLTPPDPRYYDSDFFMYNYNDEREIVKDILFFVDTSGSMSAREINACFSEIQGAIDQFKTHLHGRLFFFDADVYPGTAGQNGSDGYGYDFDKLKGDISDVAPLGGGGTSFSVIFQYIKENKHKFYDIKGVIVLTDGYCDYPDPSAANGLDVLWVYTTRDNNPPFGRYTRLELEYDDEPNDF